MRMTMWRNYVPSEVGSSKTLLQVRIALGVEKNTVCANHAQVEKLCLWACSGP